MDIKLEENERIDDLEFKNLKIVQNKKYFCFGIDAVLLSDFAKNIKKDAQVLDLGTGTGIISILLCGKTNLKKVFGIEVQEEMCKIAEKNIKLNDLDSKFEIINENILNLEKIFEKNKFDAVVRNPPYKKLNTGLVNDEKNKLISRHEVLANLEDYIEISSKMLKDKGKLFMVHRPERLVDIFYFMRIHKIEPKRVRMVFSKVGEEPKLVLVEGVKNGKEYLKFMNNIYIYDENGNYTEEILKIYGKE